MLGVFFLKVPSVALARNCISFERRMRRAVPKTVSGWIPVVRLTSDEVAKSGRTGIMTAYTENMLSRKRTLWTA